MGLFDSVEVKLVKLINERDTDKCLELMDNGYNPNKLIKDNEGDQSTLLIEATNRGLWAVMKRLISDGAKLDFQKKSNQKGALHYASNSIISTYILLSNGANDFLVAKNFVTPAIEAKEFKEYWIKKGKTDFIKECEDVEFLLTNWQMIKSPPYGFIREIETKEKMLRRGINLKIYGVRPPRINIV